MHFRSVFKSFIFTTFLIAAASVGIQAQTGTFSGIISLKKADGTVAPAAGVTVTAYSLDRAGGGRSTTTNTEGEFRITAVTPGETYAILVSGPGIAPGIQPGFKPGMEKVPVEVREGDGSTYTEGEVREILRKDAEMTDEDREKLRQQAEANAEARKKAIETNKAVNEALKAGDAAFKAKDYDTAIAKFDEGVNLDPEFAGSAPILLNYKGVALKEQGVDAYRASLKGDRDAQLAIAKTKFDEATKAFDRALEVLAAAKPETPKETESYALNRYNILNNYVEVLRLTFQTQADQGKAAVAEPIYTQYFELEKDAAKKAKAKAILGDMIFSSGDMDKAITIYREVVAETPDQPEALSGLGIALYTNGEINENNAELQEAANVLAKFLKVAPEKHLNKQTATTLLEALKTDKKITPKK